MREFGEEIYNLNTKPYYGFNEHGSSAIKT